MKIKPQKITKQIVISNQINEARFKMSHQEQKLFLYCVGIVDNRENVLNTSFKMSIKDFGNFLGLKTNSIYETARKVTKDMASRVVEFERGDGALHQIPVLSEVIYKSGVVTVHINPKLAPYLIDLKKQFTKFSLSEVLSFKSLYSMRIYQILSQWIYKGEVEYSIEELRFMLDIKELEYKLYSDFKRKVLEVALKEINKSSSLKYTYKEIKTGRKVTSIAFIIISAKEPVKDLMQEVFSAEEVKLPSIKVEKLAKINFVVMENQKECEAFKRLTKLGLSKSNSQKLLDQYQEDYILFALNKSKVENRTNVENKAGYFSSLVETYVEVYENQKQSQRDEKEQFRINEEIREQKAKRLEERHNKFREEQEELSKGVLEYEPGIFCKTIYAYLDIFISINWGFSNHPDWYNNKKAGKSEENIKIAKEIRSKFQGCISFRDFKNLIKENENWIFQAVFNEIEQFDEGSDEYYKANNNLKRLDKIELPFKI